MSIRPPTWPTVAEVWTGDLTLNMGFPELRNSAGRGLALFRGSHLRGNTYHAQHKPQWFISMMEVYLPETTRLHPWTLNYWTRRSDKM
jgi:hypothetical protein